MGKFGLRLTADPSRPVRFDPPLRSWSLINDGSDVNVIVDNEARWLLKAGESIGAFDNLETLSQLDFSFGAAVDLRVFGAQ